MKTQSQTKTVESQIAELTKQIAELELNHRLLEAKPIEGVQVSYQGDGIEFFKQLQEKLSSDADNEKAAAILQESYNALLIMKGDLKNLEEIKALNDAAINAKQRQIEHEALKATLPDLAKKLEAAALDYEQALLEVFNVAVALNRHKSFSVAMGRTRTYRLVEGKPGQYPGEWAVIESEVQP